MATLITFQLNLEMPLLIFLVDSPYIRLHDCWLKNNNNIFISNNKVAQIKENTFIVAVIPALTVAMAAALWKCWTWCEEGLQKDINCQTGFMNQIHRASISCEPWEGLEQFFCPCYTTMEVCHCYKVWIIVRNIQDINQQHLQRYHCITLLIILSG